MIMNKIPNSGLDPVTRNLATIVIFAFVLSGCVEPYPGWTVVDLPYQDLPKNVRTVFRGDFGDARVTRVERSTFESRMSGYPKLYRLFFEKPDVEIQHVTYDQEGNRVDGFDFWFMQPAPMVGTGRLPKSTK